MFIVTNHEEYFEIPVDVYSNYARGILRFQLMFIVTKHEEC